MRIGFFGGSFDPPHRGHLRVALEAAERFALERVLLAPVGMQPLKPDGASASYEDRLEMVRLLADGDVNVRASEIDAPKEDGAPNYTVDAVTRLREEGGAAAEIFVIVGIDAFLEVRRWKEPERIFKLAEWIVVSRPGFELEKIEAMGLTERERRRVHLMDDVAEDVSATELRRMLREGTDVGAFLPAAVVRYVRERGLYREA